MNAIIGVVKRVIGKGGTRTRTRERGSKRVRERQGGERREEKGGADWESSLYRQIIGVEAKTGKLISSWRPNNFSLDGENQFAIKERRKQIFILLKFYFIGILGKQEGYLCISEDLFFAQFYRLWIK